MFKVYFAPNWGLSSREMVSCYLSQTPNEEGRWNDISYTTDIDEADYVIVEDNCSPEIINRFPKERILYFSREALDSRSHTSYSSNDVTRCSFWDGTGYLYTKWFYPGDLGGVNMTYSELQNEKVSPLKTKTISCTQSNKGMTPIHVARKQFIQKYVSSYPIDVYGSISCANSSLTDNDKRVALDSYKYSLCFDNQITIKNFFGTQVTDSLLRWTVPVYGGGGELGRYFPEKSFIKIDPTNLKDVDRVYNILKDDDFDGRKDAILEARDLVMNKYNLWPTLERIIHG